MLEIRNQADFSSCYVWVIRLRFIEFQHSKDFTTKVYARHCDSCSNFTYFFTFTYFISIKPFNLTFTINLLSNIILMFLNFDPSGVSAMMGILDRCLGFWWAVYLLNISFFECALSSSFCLITETLKLNCSNDFLTVTDSFTILGLSSTTVSSIAVSFPSVPEIKIITDCFWHNRWSKSSVYALFVFSFVWDNNEEANKVKSIIFKITWLR